MVSNDNDIETVGDCVNGQDFAPSLTNAKGSGSGDNNNVILVHRLTPPTFALPAHAELMFPPAQPADTAAPKIQRNFYRGMH